MEIFTIIRRNISAMFDMFDFNPYELKKEPSFHIIAEKRNFKFPYVITLK